jgi:hypothetical protein
LGASGGVGGVAGDVALVAGRALGAVFLDFSLDALVADEGADAFEEVEDFFFFFEFGVFDAAAEVAVLLFDDGAFALL